jgi:hypothetical protein
MLDLFIAELALAASQMVQVTLFQLELIKEPNADCTALSRAQSLASWRRLPPRRYDELVGQPVNMPAHAAACRPVT